MRCRLSGMSITVAPFLLSALLSTAPAFAAKPVTPFAPKVPAVVEAPLPNDLVKATVHRLANGLTVYLAPNHERPRINAWIAVRTGSKNDPSDCTGLAHYLEHMLFKGSEKLGSMDFAKEKPHYDRIVALYEQRFKTTDPAERTRIYKEIDRENLAAAKFESPNELDKLYNQLGFDGVNAFTMNEGTVFVCDLPKNRLAAWMRLESDRFAHPVFRLFVPELEAVYEEKNRAMDNPEEGLGEAVDLALYPQHPYGTQTTLGSIEHLKNPSLQRLQAYFRSRYRPNNMCLALAGDFDPATVLPLLEQAFGGWTPAPVPATGPWPTPKPAGTKRVAVTFEAEEKVVIGWPTVAQTDPDADAVSVMDMLVDNATAGIINLKLNQAQKVKAAGSYPEMLDDAGAWFVWGTPKKDQKLEDVEALLLGCVDDLKAGAFTDADLQAVITNFEVGEKRALESDETRVERMVMSFLANEEWSRAAGRLDRLRKVTRADVLRVAAKYLGPDRVIAYRRAGKPDLPSIQKPGFTPVEIDPSRQSAFFRELAAIPAEPIAPRWIAAGTDYTVSDRPFGRLYTAANPMNDVFTLSIGVRVGTRDEKTLGAAMDLLDLAGAGQRTAEELKKTLFGMGTSVSTSASERWSVVSVSGLEANLEASLRLVFEQFANPNVAPGTLDKMIQVTLGAHQDTKKDPHAVFHALIGFASRGAESASLNELSDAEVKALNQDKLLALARSVWSYPADVRYVGTRSADDVARLYASLAPAPTKPKRPARHVAYLKPAANRVVFTHRDMVQSQVFLYAADGVLDPAREVDTEFYTNYMGGSMSSVIFQEVREARALAYAAWGGYEAGHWAGDDNEIIGELGCQADKTIEAVTLLNDILRKPPLDERRFAETKRAVVESYRSNPIHFRDVAEAVLRWEEQGITGGDPRPAWFARAQAYTLKDLGAFATRFGGTPMTLAILGNQQRVPVDQLKPLGTLETVPIDRLFPY